MGPKGQLLRWSLDTSRLEGPCLLSSIWRGRRGKPGAWAGGCSSDGRWGGRGRCYKYSSSRACLSASRSAWQDILQKGMLCWNTEPRTHGYGSAGTSCSPPGSHACGENLRRSPRVKTSWWTPPPAPDVISTHQSGHPFYFFGACYLFFGFAWWHGEIFVPQGDGTCAPCIGSVHTLYPWTTWEVPF